MRFPWMKIHGSIEALCRCLSGNQTQGFHEWKFMALLKRQVRVVGQSETEMFPWMKIHGSIEAHGSDINGEPHLARFHEWKFMALLKPWNQPPNRWRASEVSMNENSWLYWSNNSDKSILPISLEVSMNENSWLYWSSNTHVYVSELESGFHEWKFMALLKHWRWKGNTLSYIRVSMNENSWLYWSLSL